eukprot:15668469-Heterocapsa_arctica.AAC.1
MFSASGSSASGSTTGRAGESSGPSRVYVVLLEPPSSVPSTSSHSFWSSPSGTGVVSAGEMPKA